MPKAEHCVEPTAIDWRIVVNTLNARTCWRGRIFGVNAAGAVWGLPAWPRAFYKKVSKYFYALQKCSLCYKLVGGEGVWGVGWSICFKISVLWLECQDEKTVSYFL